jgi:hypothetical protein
VTGSFGAMMSGGPVDLLKARSHRAESIERAEGFVAKFDKSSMNRSSWPRSCNGNKVKEV